MFSLQAYLIALVGFLPLARGLSCGICIDATCPDTASCTAGTMLDDCGCCSICSKAEGEKCAGRYGRFGNCGEGLVCDQGKAPPGTDPFYHWLRSEGHCVPGKSGQASVVGPTPPSPADRKTEGLSQQSLNNQT